MAKKVAAKSAPKAAPKPAPKPTKIVASAKPRKKGELFNLLAEHAGLKRKDVANVFDVLGKIMAVDLAKPGKDKPKMFVVPGLMRVKSVFKPSQPERRGIDPFTKTEKTFKAKPASTAIRIRPLKGLKSMV
ncbi:MAG: HU family DNA-binding protein [Planctomycetota bacterium]|nr:HU family DNA-binding protein [Planctomycetota bacterium]